jgi:hypothetical protein
MANNQIDNIIRLLTNSVSNKVDDLALRIHAGLTKETPVDTGWARANWVPSVGTFPTEPVGSPDNISDSEVRSGISEISRWKITQGPIFITNNVPYIAPLNNGHSKQAPKGFVEQVVQRETNRAGKARLS